MKSRGYFRRSLKRPRTTLPVPLASPYLHVTLGELYERRKQWEADRAKSIAYWKASA